MSSPLHRMRMIEKVYPHNGQRAELLVGLEADILGLFDGLPIEHDLGRFFDAYTSVSMEHTCPPLAPVSRTCSIMIGFDSRKLV